MKRAKDGVMLKDNLYRFDLKVGRHMSVDSIERPQTLTEIVADRLRTAIVEGAFLMGQPLSENMLGELFKVSKSPIRRAFSILSNEGLVEIVPQKGTYVFTITLTELHKITELREILEIKALQCAFDKHKDELIKKLENIYDLMVKAREEEDTIEYLKLDSSFHQTILDFSDNDYLLSAYKLIAVKTRAALFHLANEPLKKKKHFGEHRDIIDNLKNGKIDEAISILKCHVHRHSHIDFSRLDDFGARNISLLTQ